MNQIKVEVFNELPTYRGYLPQPKNLDVWLNSCMNSVATSSQVNVAFCTTESITQLNKDYRQKDRATNVLTFPINELIDHSFIIGDIKICADVVNNEALTSKLSTEGYWAYIVIHSGLHLIGHTHDEDHSAEIMELREQELLQELGYL